MCNVDISRTIPTTLFLKTKYLKYHKISFKFRAITNLSYVPWNPWLIPRINIQKSNFYCNGFIIKKLIYWSEHTHNRPGWRSKSQYFELLSLLLNAFYNYMGLYVIRADCLREREIYIYIYIYIYII